MNGARGGGVAMAMSVNAARVSFEVELEILEKGLAELRHELDELGGALGPVLLPEKSTAETCRPEDIRVSTSPLRDRVQALTRHALLLVAGTRTLRSRLDL